MLLKQRYRVISQLGQGGMGTVYKAEDVNCFNQPVAVKEMNQDGLSPKEIIEAANAFEGEARMLASLHHVNLPHIRDYFSEAGRWYLVMDFIEGETLKEYLKQSKGWLPVKEVLSVGIQLCTVLNYLHTRQPQIIFRDLKPPNVMRAPDGHLYLIDFGIARHFKPGQTKDTRAFGSPGYCAPEQWGRAQTTVRSDIYSLGATLHQLLTGSNPAHTPFHFAPPQSLNQAVPAELGTLILQMVEMDVSKRPASMADVKQELQRILEQKALPMQPAGVLPSLGTLLLTYRGHSNFSTDFWGGSVNAVIWWLGSSHVVSADENGKVHIWEVATG